MEIQIELIIVVGALIVFFIWNIWDRFTLWRARKEFEKIQNDDGKRKEQGGEQRGDSETTGGEPEVIDTESIPTGTSQSEERGVLPTTDFDIPRENISRFRNSLDRIRRRKK